MKLQLRDENGVRKLMENNALEAFVFLNDNMRYVILFRKVGEDNIAFGLRWKSGKDRKTGLKEFKRLDSVSTTLREKLGFKEFMISFSYNIPVERKPAKLQF